MLSWGCLTLLVTVQSARSETVVFIEGDNASGLTEDTHIAAGSAATANYSDEDYLLIDTENGDFENNESRALVAFPKAFGERDGQLPAHTKVEQAILSLFVVNEGGTLSAHVIQESWDNSTVSWSARGGELGPWQAAGVSPPSCDETAAASGQTPAYAPVNFDLTDAVQMWASDPSTNHGVVLISDSTDGTDIISSENSVYPKARPALIVTYTLGDTPDTNDDTGGAADTATDTGGAADTATDSDSDDTGSGDTGSATDSGSGDTSSADTESPESDAGCGCRSVQPLTGASALLTGLILVGWRRRRLA